MLPIDLNAVLPTLDGIFLFSRSEKSPAVALAKADACPRSLKIHFADFVKASETIMRGVIIKSISPEEYQAFRQVQAIEGYVDLGMFEEAEAELRELDPAWLALEQIVKLTSRVYARLSQGGEN